MLVSLSHRELNPCLCSKLGADDFTVWGENPDDAAEMEVASIWGEAAATGSQLPLLPPLLDPKRCRSPPSDWERRLPVALDPLLLLGNWIVLTKHRWETIYIVCSDCNAIQDFVNTHLVVAKRIKLLRYDLVSVHPVWWNLWSNIGTVQHCNRAVHAVPLKFMPTGKIDCVLFFWQLEHVVELANGKKIHSGNVELLIEIYLHWENCFDMYLCSDVSIGSSLVGFRDHWNPLIHTNWAFFVHLVDIPPFRSWTSKAKI